MQSQDLRAAHLAVDRWIIAPLAYIEYGVYYWGYIGMMDKKMESNIFKQGKLD